MIKFFREITYNLMETGKNTKPALPAGRYLKYAIGEIILVVIGILIALQINNWNEQRKLKLQETTYYCKIFEYLKTDSNNIDFAIASLDKRQSDAKKLLTNLLKIQEDKAVILEDYISAIRSNKFIPTKAAIDDITSSGKLENLTKANLKDDILNYYTQQNNALSAIDGNSDQLLEQVTKYQSYTDFGAQEIPLYKGIYGEELQQLLKSKDWQIDTNSFIFKNLRDHMNMTIIICEREKALLRIIKTIAINLSKFLETNCKSK